jgi:hypothetical protein
LIRQIRAGRFGSDQQRAILTGLVFVMRLGLHGLTKTEMSVIYVLENSTDREE